ncbi:hypothetical protein AB0B94_29705, partial [Micromonospora sp. NPDC048986]|uniref:hypothetical protein n=1 Tax=Micromonospora sp. NPDC048986 TaxID=3155644 RepID=UPI00340BCF33
MVSASSEATISWLKRDLGRRGQRGRRGRRGRAAWVDGVRTPFGKAGGMYANTRADDLVIR